MFILISMYIIHMYAEKKTKHQRKCPQNKSKALNKIKTHWMLKERDTKGLSDYHKLNSQYLVGIFLLIINAVYVIHVEWWRYFMAPTDKSKMNKENKSINSLSSKNCRLSFVLYSFYYFKDKDLIKFKMQITFLHIFCSLLLLSSS